MTEAIHWKDVPSLGQFRNRLADVFTAGKGVILPSECGPVWVAPSGMAESADPAGERFIGIDDPDILSGELSVAERQWLRRMRILPVAVRVLGQADPLWLPNHTAVLVALMLQPCARVRLGVDTAGLESMGESVGWVVTADQSAVRLPTIVTLRDRCWAVDRPGAVDEASIRRRCARRIVFVCTGNTCRSPMVEAIFRVELAKRIGCAVEELPDHGYVIESAGVSAASNDRAAVEAVETAHEYGGSLSTHRSRPLTTDTAADADDLIVMTRSHLAAIAGRYPAVGGSIRLFLGVDGDLADPIGSRIEGYRHCAERIRRRIDGLIEEMSLI